MKRLKRPVSVLLSILMITSIFTALPVTASAETDTTYTITWQLSTWNTLTKTVAEGEMPVYDGETPTKSDWNAVYYEFAGWDPEPVPATEDATYTPKFEMKFKDENVIDGGMIGDSSTLYWAVTKDATDDTKRNLRISYINDNSSNRHVEYTMPEFASPDDVPWKAYKDSLVYVFCSCNVESISSYAFQNFTALETVEFEYTDEYNTYWTPSYVQYGVDFIGEHAFEGCTSLSDISLGMVSSIGQYAFSGCTSLGYADISSVYSLEQYVFENCTALSSVTFMNCSYIGDYSFSNCISLTDIDFKKITTNYSPELVVGEYAFANCTSLAHVDFPDYLTEIRKGAFTDCTSLASIKLPQYFRCIEEDAFWRCSTLNNVILPSNMESIGNNAFYGCEGMTDMYLYAEPDDNFTWTCNSNELIVAGEKTKLHVVSGRADEYRNALSGLNAQIVDDADTNIGSWVQLQYVMNVSNTVTLQNDVTGTTNDTSLTVESGKELTIDLNGHTLDRGLFKGYKPTYTSDTYNDSEAAIDNSGDLTIIDSSAEQTGKIIGARASGIINKGTLTLRSGSITGNCGTYGGGINNTYSGTTKIYGGKITNNKAYEVTDNYFDDQGNLTTHTSGGIGGGIGGESTWTDGEVYLYGGEISGNYAAAMAGGIGENDVYVSGSPKVTDNYVGENHTPSNIVLMYSNVVTVEGELTDGAALGVSRDISGIITNGFGENNPNKAVTDVFSNDDASGYLLESNGEALIAATLIDTWGALKEAVESTPISDSNNSDENEIFVTGNITNTGNENINVAAGQNVRVNLNGCTIDAGGAGFVVEGKPAEDENSTALYAEFRLENGEASDNGTLKVNGVPAVKVGSYANVYINDVDIVGEGTNDGALILYKDDSTNGNLYFYNSTVTANSGNALSFGNTSGYLSLSNSKLITNSEKTGNDAASAAVYCAEGSTVEFTLYSDNEVSALAGPGVYFESEDAILTLRGGKITSRDNYGIYGSKAYTIRQWQNGLNVKGGKGDIYLRTGQYIDCSNYRSNASGNVYTGDVSVKTSIVMETPGLIAKDYTACFRKTGNWVNHSYWDYTWYDPSDIFSVDDDAYCVRALPSTNPKKYDVGMVKAPTTWSELSTMLSEGGRVKLGGDIVADVSEGSEDTDLVVTKATTLDLNGHTINRNLNTEENRNSETPKSGRVINASYSLTITDTSENGGGKITGGYLAADASNKNGAGIYISAGTLTINGGEITGNRTEATAWVSGYLGGGGVCAYGVYNSSASTTSGSTLVMNGGKITNNYSGYNGGGVYVTKEFIMNGGEISGNTSTQYGGGVFSDKSFTLNDGVIKNNMAVKPEGNNRQTVGGGVYSSSNFIMNGGQIIDNTAYIGAGVGSYSKAEMSGGLISGNTAESNGGGWWTSYLYAVHFKGGTITNNTAGIKGGGVSISGSSSTTSYNTMMSGSPKIYGNYGKNGAADNFNVNSLGVKIAGEMTEDALIYINGASSSKAFTNNYAQTNPDLDPWKIFKSDNPDYIISTMKTGSTLVGEVCVEKNYFTETAVVLNDGITMRYKLKVVNQDENREKYVTFNWGDGQSTFCDPDKHYTLTPVENSTTNEYTVDCPIAAKEMADKITATLYVGDDVADEYEYSVKENLNSIISSSSNPQNTKNLAKALLIYGNEAQKQFSYTSPSGENVYDSAYTLTAPADTQADFIASCFNEAGQMPDNTTETAIMNKYGVEFFGASLMLRDKTTCVMYFKKGASPSSDLTVTYNGETLAPKTEDGSDIIFYEINGIRPQELTNNFTITMSDGTNSTDVPFNAGYYLGAGIYRSGSNTQLRDTLIALYNYSKAAVTYVG